MDKPMLQVDTRDQSRLWFCGICGGNLDENFVCRDCHYAYTAFQISHTNIEYINQI